MLISLHVKNMALIEEVEVEFGKGLNILSGETGAGKSILLGALNIALGTGSFRDYVSEDAEYALAELVFESHKESVREFLKSQDLPWEEGQIIISRRYKNGRSVSRINGESVPVSVVRELAGQLLDIHGQHEHQSLLYPEHHLKILDRFSQHELEGRKEEYQKQYEAYCENRKKLVQAQKEAEGRWKEMDFLRFELQEIEEAGIQVGEEEALEKRNRVLSNGRRIAQTLAETAELTGCGCEKGASEEIGRALRLLHSVSDMEESLAQLTEIMTETENLLSDFNRSLSDYMEKFSYDEEELQTIQTRLDLLNHLKRKYGKTLENVMEAGEIKKQRLDLLEHYEAYLEELTRKDESSQAAVRKEAQEISQIRRRYAAMLSEKIREALVELNFLDVRFEISFETLSQPAQQGMDKICFLIAVNPGMPLRPLQEVASGGELSRIMLAIKAVMASQDDLETLIFDEIDTGISGRTAQKVSEKMAVISREHQVICITHLAQIAAMADEHYRIEKQAVNGKTKTLITSLSEEEKIQELARILGGAQITETVLESAREMKELAEKRKK